MRTPEENIAAVMAYLKQAEPLRESFESVTRTDLELMGARLDYIEGHLIEIEGRIDALT